MRHADDELVEAGTTQRPQVEGPPSGWWKLGIISSAILVAVLAAPGLRYAYVFDDYTFLGRAQSFEWSQLLPNPNEVFYRPVSREVYFGLLEQVTPGDPTLGHICNLLILAAIVLLVGGIAARLAGPRVSVLTCVLLALFGHWAVLVAWVSGSQDLLAILFVLIALRLELDGSRLEALAMFGLAALSKETALVLAPALVAVGWLQNRGGHAVLLAGSQYGAAVVGWILVHPGVREILLRHGTESTGSYIGWDNPNRWDALAQSVPGLLNLPLTGNPTPWPANLTGVMGMALLPLLAVLWALKRQARDGSKALDGGLQATPRRLTIFGVILGLPPLLLTCLLVQHWVPYYLCFSAVGLSLVLAVLLRHVTHPALVVALLAYLVGGVWSRGVLLEPGMPSEKGLLPAGAALRTLEANFKRLEPSLPTGSAVYVSTMARGEKSVYLHLHHFQVLRVWYRDPTIDTRRPELRVVTGGPEFLFWINPGLEVNEVDLHSLTPRATGGPIDRKRYRSTLRSYAFGLAGAGQVQRAIQVLLSIDEPTTWDYAVSYRMAATLLFAYGEPRAAEEMLDGVPPLPRASAFGSVGNILTIPTQGAHLERAALRAFGFSWDDPDVLRKLLRALMGLGYFEVSERIAKRLLEIHPDDLEATHAIQRIQARLERGDQIVPPIRPPLVPKAMPGDEP